MKQAALTLEVFGQYIVLNSCDYQYAIYKCVWSHFECDEVTW